MRTAALHSPAKDKLLDVAVDLMRTKGFTATSVEEICKAAKLTKGSFFHYFDSKESLGKAALERFCSMTWTRFQGGAFQKEEDPLKRLYGLIDFSIQMSKDPMARKGCLLGTFTQELSNQQEEMRQCCAGYFDQWTGMLGPLLEEAKAKHAPKADFDARSLADHYLAVIQGSIILIKAKQDPRILERNLKHLKRYIKDLFESHGL